MTAHKAQIYFIGEHSHSTSAKGRRESDLHHPRKHPRRRAKAFGLERLEVKVKSFANDSKLRRPVVGNTGNVAPIDTSDC